MGFIYPPRNIDSLDIDRLKAKAEGEGGAAKRARRKLAVLARYDFRCCVCGSSSFLTIAHLIGHAANGNRGSSGYKVDECRVLCVSCHCIEEYEKYHNWLYRDQKNRLSSSRSK